jgi:hypothetical protein
MHHPTNRSTTSEARSARRPDPAPLDDGRHDRARQGDATSAELVDTSDDLLMKIEEIRQLESVKRRLPMSTPEFHDMARRIERKAREVFGIARSQREVGEALRDQKSDSINDEAAKEGDTR